MKNTLLPLVLSFCLVFTTLSFAQENEGYIINKGTGVSLNNQNIGSNAGQTVNNATVNQAPTPSTQTVRYIAAPSMTAPYLTATPSNDICLGSASAAGSGMGFGFSVGSTLVDANCLLLKNSARLASIGLPQSATIMFLTKSDDMLESVFLGDPKVYIKIVEEQVAVLQSKIAASKELGKGSSEYETQLDEANFKLKAAQIRIGMMQP